MDISPVLETARRALEEDADVSFVNSALNSLRRALLYYSMTTAQRLEGQKLRAALERKRRARDARP